MAEVLSILFLLVLILALALHIFTLPANWIILALAVGWKWFMAPDMTWRLLGVLFLLAMAGELLELVAQVLGAKRYGSSARGGAGAILGTIAGAIVGAPFFLGIGALIGALIGAFLGCLVFELGQGRSFAAAWTASMGALWGKFFGIIVKFSLGVGMLALLVPTIWPD